MQRSEVAAALLTGKASAGVQAALGLSQNPIVQKAQLAVMKTKSEWSKLFGGTPMEEFVTPEGVRMPMATMGADNGLMFDEGGSKSGGGKAPTDLEAQLMQELGLEEENYIKGVGGAGLNKKLMNELAESGVKYNVDDVVMITKNFDGKLLWLEKGNGSAGLQHIRERHEKDFLNRGISDIKGFLSEIIQTKPLKTTIDARGCSGIYAADNQYFVIAYGTNGFIVSFFPLTQNE